MSLSLTDSNLELNVLDFDTQLLADLFVYEEAYNMRVSQTILFASGGIFVWVL